eukprot:10295094-Ditylum_brightwellii.AAC.1
MQTKNHNGDIFREDLETKKEPAESHLEALFHINSGGPVDLDDDDAIVTLFVNKEKVAKGRLLQVQ